MLYLPLHYFLGKEPLHLGSYLPENSLDLLGPSLEGWLATILSSFSGRGPRFHPLAKISSKAHLEGDIYVDADAEVEPFSYLQGPCYV